MPYKNGIVVNVEGNGWVQVVTDKLDACADCVSARKCPSDCRSAKTVTRVRDEIGVRSGDTVSIHISRKSMLKSAAILYLVPVLFLLIGAGIGSAVAPHVGLENSSAALIAGMAGLCLGYFLIKALSMRLSMESSFFPNIDRILHRGTDAEATASAPFSVNGEGAMTTWQDTARRHPSPPRHVE